MVRRGASYAQNDFGIARGRIAAGAVRVPAVVGRRQRGGQRSGRQRPATAAAASAIDGTWKADIDSVQFDQKPDEMLLQAGQYSCQSCVPSVAVAADGAFHPVATPYADSVAVKVVDDHNVTRTSKKGGRQIGETKMTVSADGNSLTQAFVDTSVAGALARPRAK